MFYVNSNSEVPPCAAEAIFCCPTENSRHLEALLVSKDPLFNEEKEPVRRTARCHIILEKSSKNYIPLFQEAKPSRHPRQRPPPTSLQVGAADFPRGGQKCAICRRRFYSRIHLQDERREAGVICETMPFVNGSSD